MNAIRSRSAVKATKFLCLMFGLAACAGPAWACDSEIDRLTMGKLTYPKGATVIQAFGDYIAPDLSHPEEDLVRVDLSVLRGVTDRLTLGLVIESREKRRDALTLEGAGVRGHYLLLERLAQFEPFFWAVPSVRDEGFRGELGFETLKNMGGSAVSFVYTVETARENGKREVGHETELTFLRRFGLHGITALQWEYESRGPTHGIDLALGGSVSRHIFLGLEPKIGLNRQAPDFALRLQVQIYYGPYGLGGWGLR